MLRCPPQCQWIQLCASPNEDRLLLRAHTAATRPIRPMPSNNSEPGSGTGLVVNEPYSPGGGTPGPGVAFGTSTRLVAFARPAAYTIGPSPTSPLLQSSPTYPPGPAISKVTP